MAYNAIADSDIDPESPITATLMTRLRDNPIAIAAGDSGAPEIVTAAIAAGAVTTNKLESAEQMTTVNVRQATAGASDGQLGTYAFLNWNSSSTTTPGQTVLGSSLRYSDDAGNLGSTPSGTWQAMGGDGTALQKATLWLRVS